MAGNDAYTKSLLHLNSDFADVAAGGTHIWTGYGNAQIDAAIKKFGAGSLLLDGDGDYIDTPDSADWAMGSGDFTYDFWLKRVRAEFTELITGQTGPTGDNIDNSFAIILLPVDIYTGSLLHFNGADLSTVITDVGPNFVPNVWTARNHAKLSTTSPKFGSAAALFDGTDDWIDTPNSTWWAMGSGNFTIDLWIKRGATGTFQFIMGQCASSGAGSTQAWALWFNANNTVSFNLQSGSTAYTATSTGTITDTDTWHHIAGVRDGNTLRLFIDGVADGTANVTGISANTGLTKLAIGRLGEYAGSYLNGRVDECRISKGIARWTTGFTPPTAQYSLGRLHAAMAVGNVHYAVDSIADISDTDWHHVAFVRSGGTLYLFLDGILQGTTGVTGLTMNDVAFKVGVGREGEYAGNYFQGNIDEYRISKGIARWTANFTPPTDEYNGWTPPGGESFVSWIN